MKIWFRMSIRTVFFSSVWRSSRLESTISNRQCNVTTEKNHLFNFNWTKNRRSIMSPNARKKNWNQKSNETENEYDFSDEQRKIVRLMMILRPFRPADMIQLKSSQNDEKKPVRNRVICIVCGMFVDTTTHCTLWQPSHIHTVCSVLGCFTVKLWNVEC